MIPTIKPINKVIHKSLKIKPTGHETIHMEEVIIGTEQGMTFPTRIGTSMCNTLIDTGTTKSCISERYYQQLPSIKMQKLKNISVKSATGSNLTPLGMIHCSFKLGKIRFHSNLIVCRNLSQTSHIGKRFTFTTSHNSTLCHGWKMCFRLSTTRIGSFY